jgi:hypothetical protein
MEVALAWLSANSMYLVGAALLISEALGSIASVKANSIFQIVVNVLKAMQPKKEE